MSIKNVVIGTEPKVRKPYTKKIKPEIEQSKKSKISPNEAWDYFDGSNTDNGTDPMDELLSGKKMLWKKKWLIWYSNHNKNGRVMTDKEAFESGEHSSDDFFGRAYRESEFICRNKKTQVIEFQGESFVKFCDYLNRLK